MTHNIITYDPASDLKISDDWLCVIGGDGLDDRSGTPIWADRLRDLPQRCAVVSVLNPAQGEGSVELGTTITSLQFFDQSSLDPLFAETRVALVDITGLDYVAWVPLVQAALRCCVQVAVLYAEPASYRQHASPATWEWFDLSVRVRGVSPLPGLVNLTPEASQESVLVAMLGFEGARPRRLCSALDPEPRVIPIVGLPGFRVDYPATAVACNQEFLSEFRAYGHVRYAAAHEPFSTLQTIRSIASEFPDAHLYIAPLGTRPQALGAVLYAIEEPRRAELLYDHPVRSKGRTRGLGPIHLYFLN